MELRKAEGKKRENCMTKEIVAKSSSVLEARPLAELVGLANSFSSNIFFKMENKNINAKSIMGVMGLGLDSGKSVIVEAIGDDENEAIDAIEKFLS